MNFRGNSYGPIGPSAFFSWGDSYGPMARKVRLKLPLRLALVHGWLFPALPHSRQSCPRLFICQGRENARTNTTSPSISYGGKITFKEPSKNPSEKRVVAWPPAWNTPNLCQESTNAHFWTFVCIVGLRGVFSYNFLQTSQVTLLQAFLGFRGPEGPKTPVNGSSGCNFNPHLLHPESWPLRCPGGLWRFVPSDTKWLRKIIPQELFFVIFEGICTLKISGKERLFSRNYAWNS